MFKSILSLCFIGCLTLASAGGMFENNPEKDKINKAKQNDEKNKKCLTVFANGFNASKDELKECQPEKLMMGGATMGMMGN